MFLLLIFTAGTCPAVTVPGHDGTQLALSQIPDIIRHVTGQTSGDLRFDKDSLFIYGAYPRNNSHREVYSFNLDGSNNHIATWSDTTSDFIALSDYQSVAALSTSAVRSSDNGKLQLNFFVASDDGKLDNQAAYVVSNPDSNSADIQAGNFYGVGGDANAPKGTLVDVKGGMTVKGYDREVTAYLLRNDETVKPHSTEVECFQPS